MSPRGGQGRRKGRHTVFSSAFIITIVTLCLYVQEGAAEVLTPPYFNLAEGRKVTATATCGDEMPEQYCKLVGAQVCDFCDLNNPSKRHPPEYAVDGMETWWQSPPLSRGMKYNEVNFTIDLGQEFHVAYVFVRMGNSPRPGLWALEKSSDYGKTYKPWQYFSETASDCETYFGADSLLPITADDSVICNIEYSKIVPLEGGEIPINLLHRRPSAKEYFNSSVLQEWTRATNVRLRLLRTKTLLGHLMSVARQDPTVTRRYFYSIKDVSIGGRCMCNGHAELCDIPDAEDPNKLLCRCQHHTCGPQCNYCCPGFQQKAWRQSQNWQKFHCEPCNCFNHSTECEYSAEVDAKRLSLDINNKYEGGGVCKNCQHNTVGINCNKCKDKYYRPYGKHWNETDVCHPCNCHYDYSTGNCAEGTGQCECRKEYKKPLCDACSYGYFGYPDCQPCVCNLNGTKGGYCEPQNDICPCKDNYAGMYCEQCSDGYYNFPECQECACSPIGSLASACDQVSGSCTCKNSYSGRTCEQCAPGYYNYPSCSYCNCDTSGTLAAICNDTTGTCMCKEGFGGSRCDQCIAGYYSKVVDRERVCVPCNCSTIGSTTTSCDANGKCTCLFNFAGTQCDQCSPGYYKYPECLPCGCDPLGGIGVTCDSEGQCKCKVNFDTLQCNVCKEGFYNYPACEECNCDPAGVVQAFAGCESVPEGELCECKERVQGRICNECKPLYYDLQQYNPLGCVECECHTPGTRGRIGVCNTKTGQCSCKYAVGERSCTECKDGTYDLTDENVFGCVDCNCDIGGAVNNVCHKQSGQCTCKPRITGLRCDRPLETHYFPTLYQFQYEAEDAKTLTGGQVRAGSAHSVFPDFSWKGYASFSVVQNEIIQQVYIQKASVYRMVMRYVNPTSEPIVATIVITPENYNEIEQKFEVLLNPTSHPELVTVSGAQGTTVSPFVMNPGIWSISIKTRKNLHLDYFALIPATYYEASILTHTVESPCTIGDKGLCLLFGFPNISQYDSVNGAGGFTSKSGVRAPIFSYIDNHQQLKELGESEIPLVSDEQEELLLDLMVSKPGPHVMLIEYVTPASNQSLHPGVVSLTARGSSSQEVAKVHFNNCPYTFPCRQVVTDDSDRVHVFNIQDNFVGLTLKGEKGSNVAIKSVVVIPYNKWHMDYITPHAVCVRRNGTCLQAEFPLAPDSKKVEFETGPDSIAHVRPQNIFDNTSELIYLSAEAPHVDVSSKVQFPGQFIFIVHYYQPSYPESDMKALIQNGQIYEATLPTKHCPSNSGCRSVIRSADGNIRFSLTENFLLTLTADDDRGVWLDYLLIVPADHYSDALLSENKLDQSKEFISKCGNNHFHVDISQEGFCRDSVFSLTSDYNNGALPCNCDYLGSLSFECSPFGGQCQCKDNVVGRRCEACKTGFYGFPDCKPCDCPATATCDVNTGECLCATRVTGEKCDQCVPLTFGFDAMTGCVECDCNPQGVIANRLQCDLINGSCSCKPNIEGRMCDHCIAGFHSFPYCESCYCNTNGTLLDICDQYTAECFCKSNVDGDSCDECKEGTFDLRAENDAGCTKCFCFGKTTRCHSANLFWSRLRNMDDWFLVNINVTQNVTIERHLNPPQMLNESVIGVELTTDESRDKVVYFGAPQSFLGNKLKSYGGKLEYSIFYTTGLFGNAIGQGDVIIKGADTWLIHTGIEQPPATTRWIKELELRETEFRTITGIPATRELLMTVLENLKGLFIRATYWETSVTTRLQDVSLQEAMPYSKENTGFDLATSVEECSCPVSYKGSSCEECAEGFYRTASGPHGGYCVPCQCNNHAASCDVHTGICYDCQHNTQGDHCDECIEGFHGNASIGTPNDCLICACPLPVTSNNFATRCEVSSDGEHITCDCKEGYFGGMCESCDSGFYGSPRKLGDTCKPCNCSGNINPDDPESCDTITGDCLKCMNNTFGAACALCEPGFYGDAVILKDCQACICDTLGMQECDSYTGQCHCKQGVIGDKCDRCEDEHWGFDSGAGCRPCNCSIASHSRQCHDSTGQCKCMPGITGKTCDRCAPGFWNYSPQGCVSCGCNSEYSVGFGCNATTGHCECLPGVIGEKCDHCPYRWVLVEEEGCFECEACTHSLLNSTDDLQRLIDPVMTDFQNKASGYFTAQRLVYIKKQMDELKPAVKALDPKRFDLSGINKNIDSLENDAKGLDRKAEYGASDADRLNNNAGGLLNQSQSVLVDSQGNALKLRATVSHVWELANSLETAELPRVDSALAEAKQILSDIKDKDLSPLANNSQTHLDQVLNLQEKVKKFLEPVEKQNQEYKVVKNTLNKYNDILKEANDFNKIAEKKANTAEGLNSKHSQNGVNSQLDLVNSELKETERDMKEATTYLQNASYALNSAKQAVDAAGRELNEGFHINNQANVTIKERDSQLDDLQNLYEQADNHMKVLLDKSKQLNELLETSKNNSQTEHAVRGASAYPDIVKEITAAHIHAKEALGAAENATALARGLAERVAGSKSNSSNLHGGALQALNEVQATLKPQLDEAVNQVQSVKDINQRSSGDINSIEDGLNTIPVMSLGPFIEDATRKSQLVNETAANLKEVIGVQLSDSFAKSVNLSQALPKEVDDTIKTVKLIRNQLESVEKDMPKISRLTQSVVEKENNFEKTKKNAEVNMEKLKKTIAMIKDVTNRIKVGVDFKPSTNIQLKPPDNVDELGTSTHVSFYFKTPVENSFLLYLGNQEGTKLRRTKRDDFMALEVVKGYPTLTIDLGDGPVKMTHDKYVADDIWYQVIVDRVGKNVDFTIREELDNGEVQTHVKRDNLKGIHTIFNLDKDQSKLFVGGYPTSYKVQADVEFSSFEGQIEELVIGDTPVGLWNFVEAQNNAKGARERDKLINLQPSTGYSFDGEGYAILDASQYRFTESCDIQLKFKTFAKEGLLFLVGKGKSFLSIEMRDGRVFLQYRLGGDVLTMGTLETYNDGRWHTLSASRYHKEGKLTVDDQQIDQNQANGERVLLEVSGQMYFGGYPNKHNYIEVTNIGFDGCIDDVVVSGTTVDLSQNIQAFGVTPGCPVKFTRIVSFEVDGYIKKPNVSSSNNFQLSLKFKTSDKDGLIFYATNTDQSAGISLSLVNGSLAVLSQKIKMTSGSMLYNDDQWHIVTTTHNDKTLGIIVDDYDFYSSDSAPPPLHFMYGAVYVGGVPPRYVITPQGTATNRPFRGCLADATINGEIINFANSTEKRGETLGKCTPNKLTPTTHIDAPLIPDEDGIEIEHIPPTTRLHPHVTSTPKPRATTPRREEVTTMRPPPIERKEPPKQACAPYDASRGDGNPTDGFRFGARFDSRVEFDKLPGRYKNEFDFTVEFNTSSNEGLIFYAADGQHKDFVAVYMQDGKIVYAFNCGSGPAILVSNKMYNDSTWHLLEFSRQQQAGKLIVDDELVAEGSSPGTSNSIIMQPPFYYGGLENATTDIKYNLQGFYAPFDGCLKNLLMSGRPVMDIKTKVGTYPCSVTMEKGIYFGGSGGYVKLYKPFKVSKELKVTMEIKARTPSALLLSVHGKVDYLIVELINNTIVAKVNNKKGTYSAQYHVGDQNNLCDGNWHSIQVIKSRFVLTVGLNGKFSQPGVGSDPSANTNSALFIGGHLNRLDKLKGSVARQGFAGCIRNLQIRGNEAKMKNLVLPEDAHLDAHVGLCPVD